MNKTRSEYPIVVKEMDGDLFTPISIFQHISGTKKFLFESSLKHEDAGRYSFIGVNPSFELIGHDDVCEILYQNGTKEIVNERPLEYLKTIFPNKKFIKQVVPFIGGAIGYIGYDVMKHYYHIPNNQDDKLALPTAHLMFYEQIIAFDHLKQKIYFIGVPLLKTTTVTSLKNQILQRMEQLKSSLQPHQEASFSITAFQSSMSRSKFIEKVKTIQKHIQAGEVSQVVLSQRLSAQYDGNPFDFYRKLRLANPSPYMFYMDFNDYVFAGSSPESLVKVMNNQVVTNPIAGTRPRGKTEVEDKQQEQELLNNKKERLEHDMLVALSKEELTSICDVNTITTEQYVKVEKFQHVMHLVSVLSGKLKKSADAIDALTACLPAGTVSGSPKVKAMNIINELEEMKRGAYSGAIGYFSANGDCDFALAIRMMIYKDNIAYAQAGAGIVHGSIPEMEYEETLHKLKALLEIKSF